jgi:site-specific DNA-methyltransferase (adenine-specific)
MSRFEIHQGECLEVLRSMPDNSVDSIVTDPPYGLGKEPDAFAMLCDWMNTGHHDAQGSGFMGKEWDAFVPQPAVWRECLRVLKPGGHLLSFGGTRTYDLVLLGLRIAGFEIRDCIMWLYGSGFPKSRNGTWGGTALKPAHEPVVVARKPLEGTVAANVLAYGTGALNIDGCRVPATSENRTRIGESSQETRYTEIGTTNFAATPGTRGGDPAGRWPANIIHDGSDEVRAAFPDAKGQQGDLKETGHARLSSGRFGDMPPACAHPARIETDTSAARFFYCAKASKTDRNEGCEALPLRASGMVSNTSGQHITRRDGGAPKPTANNHPTVKPTELMRYLCRLVTPHNGIVLDPFAGSGSTGKAAVIENFRFIGIELDRDKDGNSLGYIRLAHARIAAVLKPEDLA